MSEKATQTWKPEIDMKIVKVRYGNNDIIVSVKGFIPQGWRWVKIKPLEWDNERIVLELKKVE